MSSFHCEHCGATCSDTPQGYMTGCEHYPADAEMSSPRVTARELIEGLEDTRDV